MGAPCQEQIVRGRVLVDDVQGTAHTRPGIRPEEGPGIQAAASGQTEQQPRQDGAERWPVSPAHDKGGAGDPGQLRECQVTRVVQTAVTEQTVGHNEQHGHGAAQAEKSTIVHSVSCFNVAPHVPPLRRPGETQI